jgi:hypothetical protein
MKSAEVEGRAFRANLKFGPTGMYDISVNESDQRLQTERYVLGHPIALFATEKKSLAKMVEVCDRAKVNLDEIQRILAGKQPGTAQAKEAFIKRVHADELLVQELAAKIDLTGSVALLDEICGHIRNAQVWELSAGKGTAEQTNDGEGAGRDIFLDPKLNFKGLHAMIDEGRTVISHEMILSTATILDALFARSEGRPEKVFLRARDVAIDALQLIGQAPVEDKDARAIFEQAAGATSASLGEVRKSLQGVAAKHRLEAPAAGPARQD